jgi:hypothetical protein
VLQNLKRTSCAGCCNCIAGYPELNPLTPHQLLSDFGGGVWLNYEVGGNFRVRVTTARGDYCVLSALMFDLAV